MACPSGTDPDIIIKSMMVENVRKGVAPSRSTIQELVAGPQGGESEQAMETKPPVSPVSLNEDDLLFGATTASVEVGMASLQVASLLEEQEDNEEASMWKTYPLVGDTP